MQPTGLRPEGAPCELPEMVMVNVAIGANPLGG